MFVIIDFRWSLKMTMDSTEIVKIFLSQEHEIVYIFM